MNFLLIFFILGYFKEPVLSSDELDEVQYSISSPGSFAFAEGYNGTVSVMGLK